MSKRSRWILLISILALMGGLGWAAYQRMTSQVTLRVAIAESRSDDGVLLNEIGKWLTANNRRTRLQVVPLPDQAAIVTALREGKVELGSVRGDFPMPGGLNSMAAMYREVAIFIATPQSKIEDWPQLKGRTIGLAGHTAPNDPLLQKILRARNLSDIKMIAIERDQIDDLLKKNTIQVVAQIAPLTGSTGTDMKAGRTVRRVKGDAAMLELADAEALAEADNRYEDYDVPVGGVRDAPPLPEESTSTLAVIRHLMIRSQTPSLGVQKTLIDFMDAKRAIAPDFPLARQIGSPGVDKDAAVKIHPGALSYFNGEEIKITDILIEWIYIVPLVIGGLGAVLTWLYNFFWPAEKRRAQDAMVELLVMRRDAARAKSMADLEALETRRDQIEDLIHDEFSEGALEHKMVTALLVAAEAADRKIDYMRGLLASREREAGESAPLGRAIKTAAQ